MTYSIQELSSNLRKELKAWRRDFHKHPELGYQEFRTSSIIATYLQKLGYQVRTGIAETGVAATLPGEGSGDGPCIMLRFDMDALPLEEETGAAYASEIKGVMHACGHDGHMAVGLGVATIMHSIRERWPGILILVFQPAEEGLGGAERTIEDGVLDNPAPDRVVAMHLWNEKEVGWVSVTQGPVMAGCDRIHIEVRGKGGHGAVPQETHDPVVAAAEIVTGLQKVVSREISPFDTAVISITSIQGGESFNVIPSTVELEGTMRAFTPEVREKQIQGVNRIAGTTALASGCEAIVRIDRVTPPVVNDAEASSEMVETISEIFPDLTILTDYRVMASEDMAYFLEQIPGCFIFIGSANHAKGLDAPHHNSRFDFDETVLSTAAALLSTYAYRYLTENV